MNIDFSNPIIWFLIAAYFPVAWIIFRNVNLNGYLKYIYSTLVFPVFFFLMILNALLAKMYIPGIEDFIKYIDYRDTAQEIILKSFIEIPVMAFITLVIPVVVCLAWYKLFLKINMSKLDGVV